MKQARRCLSSVGGGRPRSAGGRSRMPPNTDATAPPFHTHLSVQNYQQRQVGVDPSRITALTLPAAHRGREISIVICRLRPSFGRAVLTNGHIVHVPRAPDFLRAPNWLW